MIASAGAIENTSAPREPHLNQPRREFYDGLALGAFVITILLGTTRLGPVTVPIWVGFLPFLLWRFPPRRPWLSHVHPGFWLVWIPVGMVALQSVIGLAPIREDLGVYLPLACTLLVLATLSGLSPSDATLYRALMAGGVFICVSIAVVLYVQCDQLATPLTFYPLKNMASIPLGDSNYLAVFLLLTFSVALYRRSLLAVVFAIFILVTMSRSGAFFMVVAVAVWAILTFRLQRAAALAAAVGMVALSTTAIYGDVPAVANKVNRIGMVFFTPFLIVMNDACVAEPKPLPGGGRPSVLPPPERATSVQDRAAIMRGAFAAAPDHALTGKPRSYFRHIFPEGRYAAHNWPVDLILLFGVVGFLGYAGYLTTGLAFVSALARTHVVWAGILLGVAMTMLWGFIEVVILAPSYDTLLAVLFMAALNRSAAERRILRGFFPAGLAGVTGWLGHAPRAGTPAA